jgi:hypothetical protein
MGIVIYVVIFVTGLYTGFLVKVMLGRMHSYDGKIVVTHRPDKIVYTLELEDYPDTIQFKKEVILKVDASDESLDRN